MRTLLHRLGHTSAAHPWRVLLGWVIALAVAAGVASAYGGQTQENWDVPGARAQQGVELLRRHGENAANADARVVVHRDQGVLTDASGRAALADLTARLGRMPHAASVSPPRLSADGDTALLSVEYDAPVTHRDLMGKGEPLVEAVEPTRDAGLQVELNGTMAEQSAEPMKGTGELIGIAAALLVLVLAFGSVVAAGLPIGAAVVGLVLGGFGTTLLAGAMDVSPSAPMIGTMVGLGVGIDYALLLVVRFAEHLREGVEVRHAAGLATATAGRSVVFAASTVLVSLLGLGLAGLPTYSAFGLVTAISVAAVALVSLTLVPALCRLGGRRILARAERRATRRPRRPGREPLTARWAQRVGRRPLPWALGAAVVMLALAAPVVDMRTWPSDMSVHAEGTTLREGYDLVADEFGPGANGAMLAVVDHAAVVSPRAAVAATVRALESDDRIAVVAPPVTSRDGELTLVSAEPVFGPADARVSDLVRDVRADLPAGVDLTGLTPMYEDISQMLADRLWVVIAFVVGMSFLLLTMMFRSVLVPLKAALMNLLSISAAYGVLTVVFQWGWGAQLLGLDHSTPVSSWMPILLFAILFGLSMDYEVFLLGRIREEYDGGADARAAVVRGLAATGRVISCAAAIMVAVFFGFATETDPVVKQLGLGMGVAVALDATVVRMVLVPATMSLLGDLNWWMPRWLDRVLPRIRHAEEPAAGQSDGRPAEPELVRV
ncbi:MMPL family transporter [Nocardioides marmoribigeumensis]|uniref:RND superfamily putative drug exporter n=1 Tax=Nocardioides marmoribigeumensis TaxID=433649 RepID=A0ABU2BUK2_9ACTN|nr:MMPL family transporter [Nocardioides marmoribigeumensis]MDR7362310.1 RND superfamily putative drug exporter [Nocardioides marmoribigeumensis]